LYNCNNISEGYTNLLCFIYYIDKNKVLCLEIAPIIKFWYVIYFDNSKTYFLNDWKTNEYVTIRPKRPNNHNKNINITDLAYLYYFIKI